MILYEISILISTLIYKKQNQENGITNTRI